MFKFPLMLILLLLAGLTVLNAQEIKFSGSVIDSLKVPLSGANLLAIPQTGGKIKFAITDDSGKFTLKLSTQETYILEVTYIGFNKFNDTLKSFENITRHYVLLPSNEELDEIIIRQTVPVLVKKDTTQYQTKYFTDGKERKLQEILKKLPGIEVNNGSIFFKGKKIEKVMVENKTFFTGDSKLAIENIPANVVGEVEVLENYSEIPFLKNLEDSDRTVMNIKLTEGKKRFIFGDIEIGAGIKDRYLLHPSLFYYSPQTAINFIADINNVGTKKFTLQNYINFEGGYNSLMEDPTKFSLINDEFAQSLSDENFVKNTINFGASNVHQQIGKHLNLNLYNISSYSTSLHEIKNFLTYMIGVDTLSENRFTEQKKHLNFNLNKFELSFIPNENEHLKYQAYLKFTKLNSEKKRISNEFQNFFDEIQNPHNFSFEQNLQYNKQHNIKNTTSALIIHSLNKDNKRDSWKFSNSIFNSLIPLELEKEFYINNEEIISSNLLAIRLKHYFIINGKNHIYPSLGTDISNDNLYTSSYQLLPDKTINSFKNNGFNNDSQLQLGNYYAGFHYKYKNNNWLFKPGIFYHFYQWSLKQMDATQFQKNAFISPELQIDYDINSSHQLKFNYQLKSDFPIILNLADRYRFISFNRVFKGNNSLENSLYHTSSLRYFKFDLFNKYFLNLGVQMRSQYAGIQQETVLEGIDQISTLQFSNSPQTSWNFQGNLAKTLKDFKLKLNTTLISNKYESLINHVALESCSRIFRLDLSAELFSDQFRELQGGARYQKSHFYSESFSNKTYKLTPYMNVSFLWKNLLFTSDYEFQNYSNSSNSSEDYLHNSNFSILYLKDQSPWGVELAVRNIFNYNFHRQSSVTEYFVEDTFIMVQPRTVLLTLSYKL